VRRGSRGCKCTTVPSSLQETYEKCALGFDHNNNNNNNSQDDIYSAVIMTTMSLREFIWFI